MDFKWVMVEASLVKCHNMNVTGLHWRSVNIGSGNSLVLSGNKPLSEPLLTQISVAIWKSLENHLSYIPSQSDRGQWLNLIFLSGTNELFRYINVLCSFRQFLPVTRNLSKPLGPSISCKWSDCMHADYIKRFLLPNIIWWFHYASHQFVSQQLYKISSLVSYDRYFYAQNDIPGAIPDATRYAFQCINHISMYRVLITNTVSRLTYYQ